ncbi:MAG: hypothetical protein ACRELF_24175, partial [Gemmataceae bacterium]
MAREKTVAAIKDPRARSQAEISLHTQEQTEFSGLEGSLKGQVDQLLKDPQTRDGIVAAAKQSGRTPEAEAMARLTGGDNQYQMMSAVAGDGSSLTDPKLLKARAQRFKVLAANAKRSGNASLYKKYSDQASQAQETASNLQAEANPDYDPFTGALTENENAGADDARTQGGLDAINAKNSRAANHAAKSRQTANAATLKRQIDDYAATVGPTPDAIMAAQPKLASMLQQYKSAKESEVKLSGGGVDELKNVQSEVSDYINKILKGNVEAAKKMMSDMASQDADQTKANLADQLENHGGDLSKSVAEVAAKYMEAQNAAIAASDAKFAAAHPTLNPATAGSAIEARNKIIQEGAKKTIDAELQMVSSWQTGQDRANAERLTASNR